MVTRGGERHFKFLADVRASMRRPRPTAEIGYFSDAKYPDGTEVVLVALLNEFGSEHNIETAAMRKAMKSRATARAVVEAMRAGFDPLTGRMTRSALEAAAEILREAIAKNQPVETGLLARSTESRMTG